MNNPNEMHSTYADNLRDREFDRTHPYRPATGPAMTMIPLKELEELRAELDAVRKQHAELVEACGQLLDDYLLNLALWNDDIENERGTRPVSEDASAAKVRTIITKATKTKGTV